MSDTWGLKLVDGKYLQVQLFSSWIRAIMFVMVWILYAFWIVLWSVISVSFQSQSNPNLSRHQNDFLRPFIARGLLKVIWALSSFVLWLNDQQQEISGSEWLGLYQGKAIVEKLGESVRLGRGSYNFARYHPWDIWRFVFQPVSLLGVLLMTRVEVTLYMKYRKWHRQHGSYLSEL